MGYFNMFDEWAMDPKVQSMTEDMQRRHVMLLCLRNVGGTNSMSDDEISTFMRITLQETLHTKKVFQEKGFIDSNSWNVSKRNKRQLGSSESLERVKRYRARHKRYSAKAVTLQPKNEALHVTPSRARVDTYLLTNEVNKEPPNPRKRGKALFVLDSDVPAEEWTAYDEMRKAIRKPMTDHARYLAVAKLRMLASAGHPMSAVLQQSILNSWQGLFPIAVDRDKDHGRVQSTEPIVSLDMVKAQAAETERVKAIADAYRSRHNGQGDC